jgi:hypothetical protein
MPDVPTVDRFLSDRNEFDEGLRSRLLAALDQREGMRRFYTNIYDIDIDFDSATATITLDFDPEDNSTLSISEFKTMLLAWRPPNP